VHYFDRKDLKDILSICAEAEEQVLASEGMSVEVGED
jgi:hypothetical protein